MKGLDILKQLGRAKGYAKPIASTKPSKQGMPGMPMEGRLAEYTDLTMQGSLCIMLAMPAELIELCNSFGIEPDEDLHITISMANCTGFVAGQISEELSQLQIDPVECSFAGPAKLGNKLVLLVNSQQLGELRGAIQEVLTRHGLMDSIELEHGNWLAHCSLCDICTDCPDCYAEGMLKALNMCLAMQDDIIAGDSLLVTWQEADTPYVEFEQTETEPLLIGFSEGTVKPPNWMKGIAKRALAVRAKLPKGQRCCTAVGMKRANQIANGEPLSLRTLKRMKSFISRHLGQLPPGKHTLQDSKQLQAVAIWGSLDDERTINWLDRQIARLEADNEQA